jgi:hypothetical protein
MLVPAIIANAGGSLCGGCLLFEVAVAYLAGDGGVHGELFFAVG